MSEPFQTAGRTPSGLFPSGPMRPTYREAHQVRSGAVLAGVAATALWLLGFGLLPAGLRGYVWWTVFAGGMAWLTSLMLARHGDRGVAAGIAIATGVGWAAAGAAVAIRWAASGDWPLW